MTMRSVRMALGGLVLICSGCTTASPTPPAVSAQPAPGYSDQTPYAATPAPWSDGWHSGWVHLRL